MLGTILGVVVTAKFVSELCKDRTFREKLNQLSDYCDKKAKEYEKK